MHATPQKLSPAVYRRRRLAALVVLVLIVALLWWAVSAVIGLLSGGDQQQPGTEAGQTQPAASATDTAPPAPTPEPEAPEPTPTEHVEETPQVCTGTEVQVTAIVDAETYGPDQKPQLSMKLTNRAAKPCVIDVGTATQEYTIKSGEDVIWVSTHCQKNGKPQVVQLEPGKEVTSPPIEWVRERSAPDTCGGERPAAVGGGAYYTLTVSVAGIPSEPTYFSLA